MILVVVLVVPLLVAILVQLGVYSLGTPLWDLEVYSGSLPWESTLGVYPSLLWESTLEVYSGGPHGRKYAVGSRQQTICSSQQVMARTQQATASKRRPSRSKLQPAGSGPQMGVGKQEGEGERYNCRHGHGSLFAERGRPECEIVLRVIYRSDATVRRHIMMSVCARIYIYICYTYTQKDCMSYRCGCVCIRLCWGRTQ